MTIVVQVKNGGRYTLWNVTTYNVAVNGLTALHTDRPASIIQGYIESVKRRDTV